MYFVSRSPIAAGVQANDFPMGNAFMDPRWSSLSQLYAGSLDAISLDKRGQFKTDFEPNEPTYTWSGQLPPRNHKNPIYSNKIFLGGVPWDITEGMKFRSLCQYLLKDGIFTPC